MNHNDSLVGCVGKSLYQVSFFESYFSSKPEEVTVTEKNGNSFTVTVLDPLKWIAERESIIQ